jgi:hypothetical protein
VRRQLVLDRHRPTLAEVMAPAPRAVRILAAVLAAAMVVSVLAWRLWPGAEPAVHVHRGTPAFNFTYGDRLQLRDPETAAGEVVALEERRGELFVQSFAVRVLRLPPYEADPAAILPIVADNEIARLRRRHSEFDLIAEGKARVNEVPGYELIFQARLGERRLLGRVVLLAEPVAGTREAVAIELLGTPVSGVTNARDMGSNAVLKQPFRSFRFGTERP